MSAEHSPSEVNSENVNLELVAVEIVQNLNAGEDYKWLMLNGDTVAIAILELLHACGFRLQPEKVPSRRQRRDAREEKPAEAKPPVKRKRGATYMRYVASECSPGKSSGKSSRPHTNPRNGSHYASHSGDNSPLWENIVRAYEDVHAHVD